MALVMTKEEQQQFLIDLLEQSEVLKLVYGDGTLIGYDIRVRGKQAEQMKKLLDKD